MMNESKVPKPVAVCTICEEYSNSIGSINQRCGKKTGKKKCKGVMGSAIAPNDWDECPNCHATGRKQSKECDQCDGYGWIYVRGRY